MTSFVVFTVLLSRCKFETGSAVEFICGIYNVFSSHKRQIDLHVCSIYFLQMIYIPDIGGRDKKTRLKKTN